ncbi:MAG: MerR family transcriptional regulator [Burkholderiales bacterium]
MNSSNQTQTPVIAGDVLDAAALSLEELAGACYVEPHWVVEHDVEAALLAEVGTAREREWRFSSTTLVRPRRMVHLEQGFDANPELAALAADQIEEVTQWRQRLKAAGL